MLLQEIFGVAALRFGVQGFGIEGFTVEGFAA